MASIIKNIKLTNVAFTMCNTQYDVSVRFTIDVKASGAFPEKYYLIWYENETFVSPFELSLTPLLGACESGTIYRGSIAEGALSEFSPDIGKRCSVRISDSTNESDARTLCSTSIPVITDLYNNIDGHYDGKNLIVKWETTTLNRTITKLQFTDNQSVYTGESGKTYIEISRPLMDFTSDIVTSFSLNSYWSMQYGDTDVKCISTGISSPNITFFTSTPTLKAVNLSDENSLSLVFSVPETLRNSNPKFRADYILDGEVIETDTGDIEVPTSGDCQVTERIPVRILPIISKLSLRLYLCSNNICTIINCQSNEVSLAIPQIATSIVGVSAIAKFSLDNANGYYVSVDDEIEDNPVYDDQKQYPLGEVLDKCVKVAPLFINKAGSVQGLYSNSEPFFKEGFYADVNSMRYLNNPTASNLSVTIDEKLFGKALSSSISSGAFTLEEQPNKYVLSIDYSTEYTKNNLAVFIERLFDSSNPITPFGYYRIRDVIARLSPYAYEDAMFYYCSAEKGRLWNELLPGLILKIETAYFNRQTSIGENDNNGFIKGAVSEYNICFNGTNLEFDSCFDYVSGSWTSQTFNNTDFSGLVDMFWSNFRSPYYRIVYPSAYYPSTRFPHTDDDGQVIISNVAPNVSEITSHDSIIYRGRTAITTEMTVTVNNQTIKTPLGTTIENLKARYGGGKVTLKRQTGLGHALPVYFKENTIGNYNFDKSFFLFNGDHITIK
jgi:hypothetical protein